MDSLINLAGVLQSPAGCHSDLTVSLVITWSSCSPKLLMYIEGMLQAILFRGLEWDLLAPCLATCECTQAQLVCKFIAIERNMLPPSEAE